MYIKEILKQFMALMQLICIEIVWQHLQSLCIKGKGEREIRNIALRKGFDCERNCPLIVLLI